MGAALCACAGRSDDELGLYRFAAATGPEKAAKQARLNLSDSLLQTQSRAETRELLSDEEREAIRKGNSVRVIHAGGHYNYSFHHQNQSSSGLHGYAIQVGGGGGGGGPDDHADATESDEIEYYNRQHNQQHQQQSGSGGGGGFLALSLPTRRRTPPSMSQVTADAFRSKLREPIMSPRSKMLLLVGALDDAEGDNTDDDDGANDDDDDDDDDDAMCSDTRDVRRPRTHSAVYEADVDPASASYGSGKHGHGEDGDDEDDEYFEFVRIIVPPGPCGVVFQTPTAASMPPTVEGFVRMYDGSKGPIENSCLVHKGSTLCAINDLEVTALPLSEVIRALNLSSHLEREFVFRK